MRAGAKTALVDIDHKRVVVQWPAGEVTYAIDKAGNVDAQLAWDMFPRLNS